MEFASLIPNMDKDVAISIINQFPAYAESSRKMLEQFKNVCDMALESNKDSQKDAILAYRKILDDLGEALKKEELTPEERNRITEQMLEIADRISAKDTENKQFIDNLVKYGTQLTAGALLLGAVMLGVNVKGINLPKLKNKNYLTFTLFNDNSNLSLKGSWICIQIQMQKSVIHKVLTFHVEVVCCLHRVNS